MHPPVNHLSIDRQPNVRVERQRRLDFGTYNKSVQHSHAESDGDKLIIKYIIARQSEIIAVLSLQAFVLRGDGAVRN